MSSARQAGNQLFKDKDYASAVVKFTEAIESNSDPEMHILYSNRSACYAAMKKYKEALEDGQKCVELKPEWPKGYSRTSMAYFGLGENQKAAAEKKTEGNLYFKGSQWKEATEAFSQGLNLEESAVLYSNRSACYANLGFYEEAVKDGRKAVEMDPKWAKGYSRTATAFMFQYKFDEAVAILKEGIKAGADESALQKMLEEAEKRKAASAGNVQTLQNYFGNSLYDCAKGTTVPTSTLAGNRKIGIYFSAHWCPPCKQFTPMLVNAYNQMKAQNQGFELVFVSSDRSVNDWQHYIQEAKMPWKALQLGDQHSASLSQKYGVNGIPALIIINPDGTTASTDGRSDVMQFGASAITRW